MLTVRTESALKEAIKSKQQDIKVTGDLAIKLIFEFKDVEAREQKKKKNKIFKAGMLVPLLLVGGPLGWLMLGGTTIGAIMTQDEYRKYEVSMGTDTVYFKRK